MATIPINEQWVDSAAVAQYFGFTRDYVTRMARENKIPFVAIRNGAKTYRRFRLSLVEAAITNKAAEGSE